MKSRIKKLHQILCKTCQTSDVSCIPRMLLSNFARRWRSRPGPGGAGAQPGGAGGCWTCSSRCIIQWPGPADQDLRWLQYFLAVPSMARLGPGGAVTCQCRCETPSLGGNRAGPGRLSLAVTTRDFRVRGRHVQDQDDGPAGGPGDITWFQSAGTSCQPSTWRAGRSRSVADTCPKKVPEILLHGGTWITYDYMMLHVYYAITLYYMHYIQLHRITCITYNYIVLHVLHTITSYYLLYILLHRITCITYHYMVLHVLHTVTAHYIN